MPSIAAEVRTKIAKRCTRADIFLLEEVDVGSRVVVAQP